MNGTQYNPVNPDENKPKGRNNREANDPFYQPLSPELDYSRRQQVVPNYKDIQDGFNKKEKDGVLSVGNINLYYYDETPYEYAGKNIQKGTNMSTIGEELTFDKVNQVGSIQDGFDKHAQDFFYNLVEETAKIKNGMELMPWQKGYIDPVSGAREIANVNKLFNDYKENIPIAYGYASDLKDAFEKGNGPGGVSKINGLRVNEANMLMSWIKGDPNVYLINNDGQTALYTPKTENNPGAMINLAAFSSAMEENGEYIYRQPEDRDEVLLGIGEFALGNNTDGSGAGLKPMFLDFEKEIITDKMGNQTTVLKNETLAFKPDTYLKAIETAKTDNAIQRRLKDYRFAASLWADLFNKKETYDPSKHYNDLLGLTAKWGVDHQAANLGIGSIEGIYGYDAEGNYTSEGLNTDLKTIRKQSSMNYTKDRDVNKDKILTNETNFNSMADGVIDVMTSGSGAIGLEEVGNSFLGDKAGLKFEAGPNPDNGEMELRFKQPKQYQGDEDEYITVLNPKRTGQLNILDKDNVNRQFSIISETIRSINSKTETFTKTELDKYLAKLKENLKLIAKGEDNKIKPESSSQKIPTNLNSSQRRKKGKTTDIDMSEYDIE